MERLEGPLADLIAAEREEVEAIPKSREAAWAGIAAGWPTPPPPGGGAGAAEAVTAAAAAKSTGMALKVVAVLAVGSSIVGGVWATRSEPTEPLARVAAPAVESEPGPSAERPPALPMLATPPPRSKAPTPRSIARKPRATPVAPSLGLAEELALVDAMRRDVAARRYDAALERGKEHRKSFPEGALRADRLDLEAAARCGRGEVASGRALAERKAERWPRAPHSDRVRTLCQLGEG